MNHRFTSCMFWRLPWLRLSQREREQIGMLTIHSQLLAQLWLYLTRHFSERDIVLSVFFFFNIVELFIFFFLFEQVFYFIFYFTILYWFCCTSTWICHGWTRVPNPEPPSHLPPHTITLGHPSAPAPSFLYPASNLDWWFIPYMILYMFQCHFPKSSPHPSPAESKWLFYTSVSLLLSHIQNYLYHLSKSHIYALVYCIGVFLSCLLHSV